jgi:hypothetical protein
MSRGPAGGESNPSSASTSRHDPRAIQPIVAATVCLLLLFSMASVYLGFPKAMAGYADFRHLFTAGYMVRTGHGAELHDYVANEKFQNTLAGPGGGTLTFNHLAYEALIYLPFSLVGYRTAYILFCFVNLALLVLCGRMLYRYFSPLKEFWRCLPAALIPCFLPVAIALLLGQDSIILLLLFVCAMLAIDKGKEFRGGILLGLTLFKFQYALPIAFLFLLWRQRRVLKGFMISAIVVSGVSLWIVGLSGLAQYVPYILSMSKNYSPAKGALYGIQPASMANLRGLIASMTGASSSVTLFLTFVLSVLAIVWAASRRPSLPLALIAAILVSYHSVLSDMTLLVLPLGLLLAQSREKASTHAGRGASLLACVLVLGLGPTLLLLAGGRSYCLLGLPLVGLLVLWDGTYRSPAGRRETPFCPQKETEILSPSSC